MASGRTAVSSNALDAIKSLTEHGRFQDALSALSSAPRDAGSAVEIEVLRLELLERVGTLDQASDAFRTLSGSKRLNLSQQSRCELVRGKIEWEQGKTDAAISTLHKAVALASKARDARQRCWANLQLALVVADRSGTTAASPILSECR